MTSSYDIWMSQMMIEQKAKRSFTSLTDIIDHAHVRSAAWLLKGTNTKESNYMSLEIASSTFPLINAFP